LGDENTKRIGVENLQKIHNRLRELEGDGLKLEEPSTLLEKYTAPTSVTGYNPSSDIIMGDTEVQNENVQDGDVEQTPENGGEKKSKKRKRKTKADNIAVEEEAPKKKKKKK